MRWVTHFGGKVKSSGSGPRAEAAARGSPVAKQSEETEAGYTRGYTMDEQSEETEPGCIQGYNTKEEEGEQRAIMYEEVEKREEDVMIIYDDATEEEEIGRTLAMYELAEKGELEVMAIYQKARKRLEEATKDLPVSDLIRPAEGERQEWEGHARGHTVGEQAEEREKEEEVEGMEGEEEEEEGGTSSRSYSIGKQSEQEDRVSTPRPSTGNAIPGERNKESGNDFAFIFGASGSLSLDDIRDDDGSSSNVRSSRGVSLDVEDTSGVSLGGEASGGVLLDGRSSDGMSSDGKTIGAISHVSGRHLIATDSGRHLIATDSGRHLFATDSRRHLIATEPNGRGNGDGDGSSDLPSDGDSDFGVSSVGLSERQFSALRPIRGNMGVEVDEEEQKDDDDLGWLVPSTTFEVRLYGSHKA